MSTEIFLGLPPAGIRQWIIEHAQPVGHPETRITFSDGSSNTYEWSGKITEHTMLASGLYDDSTGDWIKELVTVDIGNTVTSIGNAFGACRELTSVTIPDSVTSIGGFAFAECIALTSVTFNNFTKNEVKSLITTTYIFGEAFHDNRWQPIEKSFTVICTDGSMTVHFSADDPATMTFTDL